MKKTNYKRHYDFDHDLYWAIAQMVADEDELLGDDYEEEEEEEEEESSLSKLLAFKVAYSDTFK